MPHTRPYIHHLSYVCLAACIENTPVVGVRRSTRVNAQDLASKRVAQLLLEQTLDDACYMD